MVKITYIWHDCFYVEMPSAVFVFDYWQDVPGAAAGDLPSFMRGIPAEKPLYVLVSHGHKDHFNPDIYSWASHFRNIRYVISRDVYRRSHHVMSPTSVYAGPKVDPACVAPLHAGEEHVDSIVRIAAFPSTDIGVSFIVECDGRRVFHAGDLNAWLWLDDSTQQEINKALGDYRACLRDISSWLSACPDTKEGKPAPLDYAFFPVDSRLGRDYWTGASMFVRQFDVRHFFPMHFGLGTPAEQSRYQADALRFDLYADLKRGEYIPLAIPGTAFLDAGEQYKPSEI